MTAATQPWPLGPVPQIIPRPDRCFRFFARHCADRPACRLAVHDEGGAGGPPQPGFFGGFLGHACDPLFVLRDPNAKDFRVPELTLQVDVGAQRLAVHRALYERLERSVDARVGGNSGTTMSAFQSRAIDLLTSPETQQAFQIDREPDRVRDAYGRNIYGQSVLLARRLIEVGTRAVTVSWARTPMRLGTLMATISFRSRIGCCHSLTPPVPA